MKQTQFIGRLRLFVRLLKGLFVSFVLALFVY